MAAMVKGRFDQIDSDHDGVLDISELTKFADTIPGLGNRQAAATAQTDQQKAEAQAVADALKDPTP
jgi:hypothetical protein